MRGASKGWGGPPVRLWPYTARLQRQPITTANSLVTTTGLTPATVNKTLVHLERLKIVKELTSRQRGRVFGYSAYAAILNEGMSPLEPMR